MHSGKTYHAGEDFLDVVDGLRAIDEAIRFLNLDCGDRIGHALALGVNVAEWYQGKGCQISLSTQDHLDNIAWMYHALKRYKIEGCEVLKDYLLELRELYQYQNDLRLNKIMTFLTVVTSALWTVRSFMLS